MTTSSQRHVGVIGLAVMGENLALNIERNGFPIAVYNRTWERTEEFINGRANGLNVAAGKTLPEFVALLERPRRIIIMVKAGAPVDAVIAELIPLLQEGDMIIDGGNSLFTDSERRSKEVEAANLMFVGMGISGGEEGALWGPSLMPGGPMKAYVLLEPMLQAISAKASD
ncbi:MAG: NADP-dependent phosphogluconate dehydrogenase, partial [Alphaproteobacteria bacterium]|nr:NADP-dependent phosphogluconate dehydrogenase [Alphaproteobacteria bacterium]